MRHLADDEVSILRTTCDAHISTIEDMQKEIVDAQAALERDRTKVAEGVTAIKKAIEARDWLREGRGPYEWDDDRWHTEFAYACTEILDALEPLARIAADWSNCPKTETEIKAARGEE